MKQTEKQINNIAEMLELIKNRCKRLEDKLDEANKIKDISRNKDWKRGKNFFQWLFGF